MIPRSDTKIVPGASNGFSLDVDNSSGLSLRVRGGVIVTQTGFRSVANKTLTLTASAVNYVECDDAGAISSNTTGFTGVEDWRGTGRDSATQIMTVSGAIREDAELVLLNSTTPLIAATIAAPRVGRRLYIAQIDSGTAGHTVTLTAGTWNGTATIATFNALGEALEVFGQTAIRFGIVVNIQSVGLS